MHSQLSMHAIWPRGATGCTHRSFSKPHNYVQPWQCAKGHVQMAICRYRSTISTTLASPRTCLRRHQFMFTRVKEALGGTGALVDFFFFLAPFHTMGNSRGDGEESVGG